MKDIDFDELHEAVNAAMDGGKAKPKKSKVAHSKKNDEVKSTVEPQPEKMEPPQAVEPKGETVRVRRPLPKLATHQRTQRGMAMDIVPPKPVAAVPPPSARPARTAPSLQPTGPVTPEPTKPAEAPTPKPTVPETPEPTDDMLASINMDESRHQVDTIDKNTRNPHASQWPDPLEVHGFNDKDKSEAPQETAEPKKEEAPLSQPTTQPPTETTAPLQPEPTTAPPETPKPEPAPSIESSPFVSTNVEKRPLGAYANQPSAPGVSKPDPAPAVTTEPTVDSELPAKQKTDLDEPQPPLQQELSPEVVAVESQEPEFTPGIQPATRTEDTTDLHSVSQMAIPKQYKETEYAPSTEERPVFDTKEYHPPIAPAHAAHRTGSPWGMVMIVVLILLLIGSGLLAYLVMTGTLDITRWF